MCRAYCPGRRGERLIAARSSPRVNAGLERRWQMALFKRIATIVRYLIERRRLQWVEVSVARARMREGQPRLFDLSDL